MCVFSLACLTVVRCGLVLLSSTDLSKMLDSADFCSLPLVQIIKNSDDFEEGGELFSPRPTMETLDPNGTIFSSQGQGVPLKVTRAYTDIPTWLSASNYLRKHPAQVVQDTMSFHLLDQGFGTHTLLTVRQLDGERQKHFTLEQQSRAGVLGRIVSGVWVKLAQVWFREHSCMV